MSSSISGSEQVGTSSPARRYLIAFALPIALFLAGLCANYRFLVAVGENTPIEEIASRQRIGGGMYMSAVREPEFKYKLALYEAALPEFVVLGSSRVLQFHDLGLGDRFLNLGRMVTQLEELEAATKVLAKRAPRVVLLGVDFWWFNSVVPTDPIAERLNDDGSVRLGDLIAPFRWLLAGRVPWAAYVESVTAGAGARDAWPYETWGMAARSSGTGYWRDGSLIRTLEPEREASAPAFDEIVRIQRGRTNFAYSESIDEELWRRFVASVKQLRSSGAHVVTFLPPLAPALLKEMQLHATEYGYVSELRQRLHGIADRHLDFHEGLDAELADSEFIDGFHTGDVATLRLLLAIADSDPIVTEHVRRTALTKLVQDQAGQRYLPFSILRSSKNVADIR